jgi:hypothetical protein
MTPDPTNPARGGAAGSGDTCLLGSEQAPGSAPAQKYQADEEWKAAYRRGREGPWRTRVDVGSPPLSDAFKAHLDYLDQLKASIPGPLVLRDEQEAAEWRKYCADSERVWSGRARR